MQQQGSYASTSNTWGHNNNRPKTHQHPARGPAGCCAAHAPQPKQPPARAGNTPSVRQDRGAQAARARRVNTGGHPAIIQREHPRVGRRSARTPPPGARSQACGVRPRPATACHAPPRCIAPCAPRPAPPQRSHARTLTKVIAVLLAKLAHQALTGGRAKSSSDFFQNLEKFQTLDTVFLCFLLFPRASAGRSGQAETARFPARYVSGREQRYEWRYTFWESAYFRI